MIIEPLMTDAEVAKALRLSLVTLRRYLRLGPPRNRHCDARDVRLIPSFSVGGQRRWPMKAVNDFINGKL